MVDSKFVVSSAKMPLEDAIEIAATLVAQLPGLIAEATEYFEESATGVFEPLRRTRIEVLGCELHNNPMRFWLSNMSLIWGDVTGQWSVPTLREENQLSVHRVRLRLMGVIGSGNPEIPVSFNV